MLFSLALLWFVWSPVVCGVDDKQVLADIKQLDSNRNVPALFKRTYMEWAGETECISLSLKSSEADIKQKGPLRFSMKARTSARSGKPLMKVELWLEFYNLSKEVKPFNKYEAIVRPTDSRIQSTNQTSSEPIISDEGRLVEISFNVTEIYHTSKVLGKKNVHFRININGHPKRVAKELHGAAVIKAFLIIQEYEEICNDYFPIRQPGRAKRSFLESGRIHTSSEKKRHAHDRKFQPTVNSMLGFLFDIVGRNISRQNLHQKESSRKLLKSLRPGISSRAIDGSSEKKKRHIHRFSHSIYHHDHNDMNISNKNRAQKMLKTLSPDSKNRMSDRTKFNHGYRTITNPRQSSVLDINRDDLQKRSSSRNVLKSFHPNSDANTRTSCGLKDWYVSFQHIGWDSWVIAPAGVRAKTCSGVCSFPLGSHINSTAHAHLQSFVYYFKGEKWPACCVPNDFEPLTMILYDVTDQLLFMAKYPNMIATSCACL